MKSKELWSQKIDKPNDPNSTLTNQVLACTYLNDGQVLIVAVGDTLLLYDTDKFEMVRPPVRGFHKDTITCLTASKDGLKVASGGADKTVIIWNYQVNKFDAENKYTHTDVVYCVAFSPLKAQIFSGSGSDFALWIPGQNQIERLKYKEKIISCAWSGDGQQLAFGTMGGIVVITDRQASQLKEIQISKTGPIWCMEWSPISYEYQSSILTVGVWTNCIYTLDSNGQQIGPKLEIPMDPLSINYSSTGDYFIVSGNNNKISLYSRDGVFLSEACQSDDWIWTAKLKPKSTIIAYGTNDGDICVTELIQGYVNSIYQDKYIEREQLTDALIIQMSSGQKARIKCKELVKKVGIYKEKVAILCGIKVLIYNCVIKGEEFMKYKQFKKFTKRVECEFFNLCSSNVVMAFGKKIISYNFNGDMDRTWTLDSDITTMQQCGGPNKRELILIGTDNGSIYKIFLDNSFPILQHKVNQPIKYAQLSAQKRKLAFIDGNSNLLVADVITKETIFGEMGVEGVAFNEDFEDLIAYSGKGLLFVKCLQFPPLNQKINGNIIGFKGSKLFLHDGVKAQTIEIQQTASMLKYLEKKDFNNAFKIACLGVTEQDVRSLGIEALMAGEFDIARRCFLRNKDFHFIDLLLKYEKLKLDPNNLAMLNAEALAYQGKYMDAGNLLLKAGLADKAVELFSELKRWDDAKNFAKRGDVVYRQATAQSRAGTGRAGTGRVGTGRLGTGIRGVQPVISPVTDIQPPKIQMNKLLKEQAEWTKETGDWKAAAELFVACGEFKKAIDLYGQNKLVDPLIDLCRMMDKSDNLENIQLCATFFKKLKHHGGAKEAFLKLNDIRNLMLLHIQFEKWQEAFIIGRANPELMELAKVPYADYLLRSDRYEDALKAYKSAGRFDISMKMTKDMAKNCLEEKRYHDASQYLWNLAIDCLQQVKDYQNRSGDDEQSLQSYQEYSDLAEVYLAYQKIHNFIEEPFQPLSGNAYFEQIMNAARFIISKWKSTYQGVKMSYVYYALARTSKSLGCFKTARSCYQKLHSFKIPAEWSEEIDLNSLLVITKQYNDEEIYLPVCLRCLTKYSLTSTSINCVNCQHPLISSQLSYISLPLVEFKVDSSMTRIDVENILNSERNEKITDKMRAQFMDKVNQTIERQNTLSMEKERQSLADTIKQEYLITEIGENIIKTFSSEEVLILDFRKYCPSIDVKYYKNMTETPIHSCNDCGRFFLIDEHQFEYAQKRECPFCRVPDKYIVQKDVFDI